MEEEISKTQAYKVLDVREYFVDLKGYLHTNSDCNINGRHIFAIICKDEETGERRRFHFFEGYTREFLKEESYYGYSGDYNLLVPGDRFKIIQTDTYKKVKILTDVK